MLPPHAPLDVHGDVCTIGQSQYGPVWFGWPTPNQALASHLVDCLVACLKPRARPYGPTDQPQARPSGNEGLAISP